MGTNLLLELLRFAARGSSETSTIGLLNAASAASEREFRWLLDSGLGPLLYHSLQRHIGRLAIARRDQLHAADLIARVYHGEMVDTAAEVIDAAASAGVSLTLLKGISVGRQCYPEAHFRPMSDVDVLLPVEAYATVEATLLQRGYARGAHQFPSGLHHGTPLRHVERGTWVELHTGLFPRDSELLGPTLFGVPLIRANSSPWAFAGRPILQLNPELQLVYVACTWHLDMTLRGYHASFVPALFDATYLLKSFGHQLDWERISYMLDNELATAAVVVLLSFLVRYGLCPEPPILPDLAARQRLAGPVQVGLILALVKRCLLGGRAWRLTLPPPVAGRYSVRRQFNKRLRPYLSGAA